MAVTTGAIAVRDSKHPAGGTLIVTPPAGPPSPPPSAPTSSADQDSSETSYSVGGMAWNSARATTPMSAW
ncbi:MAG TPA: DUF397 domain-containing protein, partial [Pseudonocardiaceae bacterium]|nr:DUF397 domain-containing protein [Pseudonocardiaceae bacterium]